MSTHKISNTLHTKKAEESEIPLLECVNKNHLLFVILYAALS